MIISEPRFAAAYYTVSGEVRRFDDIGEMCTYYGVHLEEVARFWVHDDYTEAWIPAGKAHFVRGDEVYTPMAFGMVTFAAKVGSRLLAFDDLLGHYGIDGHAHDHEQGRG